MESQLKKFEESEELANASRESVDELNIRHKQKLMYQQLLLGAPDSYLRDKFEQLGLGKDGCTVRCSPSFGPKDSVFKVDRCLSKN